MQIHCLHGQLYRASKLIAPEKKLSELEKIYKNQIDIWELLHNHKVSDLEFHWSFCLQQGQNITAEWSDQIAFAERSFTSDFKRILSVAQGLPYVIS